MRLLTAPTAALVSASILTAVAGCGASNRASRTVPHSTSGALRLSSSAFLDGSSIPRRYTCDGEDTAPPLRWTDVPARARSLALLVEDQNAPGGAFVHWSVYALPRGSSGTRTRRLPTGSAVPLGLPTRSSAPSTPGSTSTGRHRFPLIGDAPRQSTQCQGTSSRPLGAGERALKPPATPGRGAAERLPPANATRSAGSSQRNRR
jgi:hypothetical protein